MYGIGADQFLAPVAFHVKMAGGSHRASSSRVWHWIRRILEIYTFAEKVVANLGSSSGKISDNILHLLLSISLEVKLSQQFYEVLSSSS